MTDRARFDQNNIHTLTGASSTDQVPKELWVNPNTHELLVSATSGLVPVAYDYIAYTNTNSTTDTYVFKTGGSGGTTVATITIVYTDSTKSQVSTVART